MFRFSIECSGLSSSLSLTKSKIFSKQIKIKQFNPGIMSLHLRSSFYFSFALVGILCTALFLFQIAAIDNIVFSGNKEHTHSQSY